MKFEDADFSGKRVLVRVDFNVPLDERGRITDPTRIEAALPTILAVLKQGASVILMSHLGRPKGTPNLKESLAPCAAYLRTRLPCPVLMAPDCIGIETKEMASHLKPGEVLMLENLRFHLAEEKPESDPTFAQQLAELGDVYINDAFGTAHRKHSSTYTVAQYFPGRSAMGLLFEKEIQFLGEALTDPKRPFYALVGGAKISTKLGVLYALLEKVDKLFIGGAMAYTFMAAEGKKIGHSLYEPSLIQEAKKIKESALKRGIELLLPLDLVAVNQKGEVRIVTVEEGLNEGEEGVDIGPQTVLAFGGKLRQAKTLFWNGPFGKYEEEAFARGTLALLQQFASLDAITIIGGGDLVAAASQAGLTEKVTHVSTGGGASLEFIEKGTLPVLASLQSPLPHS